MAHDGHGSHVNYLWIFGALCVLTAISCVFDVVDFGSKAFVACAVLAVAVAKALFVMSYFMHLKFEGKWKYVILLPTSILAVGLMVALAPDIGVHYYIQQVPQTEGAILDHAGEEPHGVENETLHH